MVSHIAASVVETSFRWLNENQGVLALVIFVLPAGAVLWRILKRVRGISESHGVAAEFAHAAKLKKEMEEHAEWEPIWGSYGEYLIRDADRKLPHTQENHSKDVAKHSIVVLTAIEKEYLQFTAGSNFAKHIKQVGDSWYFADATDKDAIRVEYIYWINYRDIVCLQWEIDEYWEWPQVCCRFESPTKFPFTRMFFGQRITGVMPRPWYRSICEVKDVTDPPPGLWPHLGN
jgi:hypothetical protein